MSWFYDILQRIMTFVVSQIITIPFAKWPFQDLKHPMKSYEMQEAMNLRIRVKDSQEIGAWFLQPFEKPDLPQDSDEQYQPRQGFIIQENETVILYLHGNAATRSQYHRRELYRILQKMGYYVLAIDYRGYGDSSWISPTQSSMAEDAKAAFNWLVENSHPSANIYIWGHSLGTGVTSKLAHILNTENVARSFSGLILEAPFNRMLDEVQSFKASRLLPMIGMDIRATLAKADMSFDSTHWLSQIEDKPIFIMHAEDDEVIPFQLAYQLYNDLKAANVKVQFQRFAKEQKLGHDGIFKAVDPISMQDVVARFVASTSQ